MEFWEVFIIGALVLIFINDVRETIEAKRKGRKEAKRKDILCDFEDGISEEQFKMIVRQVCRPIKRLIYLSIEGPIVCGTVRTSSGISEWDFQLDFNDYGHITGEYWLSCDNKDSIIPESIAENIKKMIRSFPEGFEQDKTILHRHTNSNVYGDAEFTGKVQDSTNSETTRRQKLSQDWKKRIIKKIKFFLRLVVLGFLLCVILFAFYKYKEGAKRIEVGISSSDVIGQNYTQIVKKLEETGFTKVYTNPVYDLEIEDIEKENTIVGIEIHGENKFYNSSKYPYDAPVKITFHALKDICMPISARKAKKMDYNELETMLKNAGFININTQAEYDLITGWITKDGTVKRIFINGEKKFSEKSSYRPDAEIIITYHTFKQNDD